MCKYQVVYVSVAIDICMLVCKFIGNVWTWPYLFFIIPFVNGTMSMSL